MIDRKIPPSARKYFDLQLPPAEQLSLDNGIPLWLIDLGTQPVLRVEIIFLAGRPYEHKHMAARATARLLKEGTAHTSGEAIAEQVDYYGATLSTPFSLDTSRIILYCLTRHFHQLMPLLCELLTEPAFPEEELQSFIKANRERLKVDMSKTDFIAYREMTEYIFGAEHPYGYNSTPGTYTALQRDDLTRHFEQCYRSGNCLILVSGKPDSRTVPLINEHLGRHLPKGKREPILPQVERPAPEPRHISLPKAKQTAIRIGRRMFNRKHPDFLGMGVLTNLLGGYFGSRLMTNLREEKGLTYNVYASLDTFLHDGYLYIGAEVGNKKVKQAVQEIYREMEKLKEEPVPEEELSMLRTYMLGNLLNLIDGPFNVGEVYKGLALERNTPEFFHRFVETVKHISAEELQDLARKYLQREEFWEVVVGP